MRTRRWAAAALAAGMAGALALVPTMAQAASATLSVQVGGDSLLGCANGNPKCHVALEGMRFLAPPTFTVHQGDTINFNFAGFHTATLLPTGVGADDWRMDNTGPGGAFSLVQPDGDDSAPTFQFNKAAVFPTDPSCGASNNPCAYDGSSVVNSGAPINSTSFAVTINAAPGTNFWVLCLIHSMMEMRISVVPDATTTTTQAQIDSYAAKTQTSDQSEAKALLPKLQKQTRHRVGTSFVWDAYAGFDGDGWGLDGMFPKNLHIKKGEKVRWHFSQLVGNIHTVTFPRSAAINFSNKDFGAQILKCEGAGADTAVDSPPPTFCSTGGFGALEIELRGIAVLTQGGSSYAGSGLHSSGVRGPDGLTTHYYQLKFTRRSSTGFNYACGIHGGMMSGKVYVS